MRVSGFTLVRNGTAFDYPYLESLRSLLPAVDELIVNVGVGTDDTLDRVRGFAQSEGGGKVVVFESEWPLQDPEKKKSGLILSEQTNLALDRCRGDWCVYLQADEVLHQDDLPQLRSAVERAHSRPNVDALVFDYVHFYGSYDVVQRTRSAYRREVRAIRRGSGARSVGDAQSFRLKDGGKPKAVLSGARIFHYGWVRTPQAMREKTFFMDQLYHGDPSQAETTLNLPRTGDNYLYKKFWGLERFRGTHPEVMRERIRQKNWNWDIENSPTVWSSGDLKKVVSDSIESVTGWRPFEYRSYKLVR